MNQGSTAIQCPPTPHPGCRILTRGCLLASSISSHTFTPALSQIMESSLAKAEENEAKAVERYNEGKVSVVEVIDAQTYRQTSQVNYVQAKAAAQGHYSELIKALHGYDYR